MKYLERLVLALLLLTWCGCGSDTPGEPSQTDGGAGISPGGGGTLSCDLVNERLVCRWI